MSGKQVGAVVGAIAILRALGEADEPMRLVRIVAATGLNGSTCLNILRTLSAEQIVAFDPATKCYELGEGLIELAEPSRNRRSWAKITGALDRAADALGLSLVLWRRVGLGEAELIATAEAPTSVRVSYLTHMRVPLFWGAIGRLYAADGDLSEDELRAGYEIARPGDPKGFAGWLDEVREARERGYACDEGITTRGVHGIAVRVGSTGALRYSCGATRLGPIDPGTLPLVVQRLRDVAAVVAANMPADRAASTRDLR